MQPTSQRNAFRSPSRPARLTRAFSGWLSAGWLAACAACAATGTSPTEDVRSHVRHGRFDDAVRVAEAAVREHPGDVAFERLRRDAHVAWNLEQGRRSTFEDQDDEALVAFGRALELDGECVEARDWIAKTNKKLARRWLDSALELHAKDDIEGALTAYEKSLSYLPADRDALTGRALSALILDHRALLGQSYFRDGVHALADYWLEQARSRFTYARKYKPEDERARERKQQVDTLLAIQRMAAGRDFESRGKFGAARNEYRLALLLDPEHPGAKADAERCKIEMEVQKKLEAAGMNIVRGRFDKAAEFVAEAQALTVAQKDLCEGKLAAIREARLDKAYREALALERDYRYEDAIVKYGELLQQADFYKDVITRKESLEEYVQRAGVLYERARATNDPAAKLALLEQIQLFWPEYRDVAEQVKSLLTPPGG